MGHALLRPGSPSGGLECRSKGVLGSKGVWRAALFVVTEGSTEKGMMESQGGTDMGGSME